MATTPNTYGRLIGRVGALAVALGIGVAIADSPGIAAADDGSSGGSSESSAGGPGAAASGDDSTASTSSPADAPDASDEASDDADADDQDDPQISGGRDVSDELGTDEETATSAETRAASDVETPPTVTRGTEDVEESASTPEPELESETMRVAVASAPSTDVQTSAPVRSPAAPAAPPVDWAMLGAARREVGQSAPVSAPVSPLATPEQLAAERIAERTVCTLPVALMKVILRQQFSSTAHKLYPGGVDADNMAALDRAVDEYTMAAAFQQQLLDSMNPKVVTQVAPPHTWFGQDVPGSRIFYDNPDTIYRFMGVNGASEYVIKGRLPNRPDDAMPADTTFSVLEGLAGTTSSILTAEDLEIDEDGNFVITVSTEPANGRPNHLQLTAGSTIIAARNTLGDWNSEEPMSLSIERVGGPPNSLFAQLGGFAFLGQFVATSPVLTSLVSLVPPLPVMPPLLRGVFTAAILIVRGGNEQAKYMALATEDASSGTPRKANVLGRPASNAEFLANQLQSNGHFQLADDEALVLTIDPGRAGYFVVPTYNIWTITDDYWNLPTSLNDEQALRNGDDRTYTVVVSPTDPGVANWVSTGGLNQGTISIRFQDLGPEVLGEPRIVDQRVMSHEELRDYLPPDDFVTAEERAEQLAARKAGFDERWAPYPQP